MHMRKDINIIWTKLKVLEKNKKKKIIYFKIIFWKKSQANTQLLSTN